MFSGDDLYAPYTNYLELKIDNTVVDWGDFNPEHVYTVPFTSTDRSPLSFKIMDNAYGDNVGSLTAKIYELQ